MNDFVLPILCLILLFFCMFLLTTLRNMQDKLRYAEDKSKNLLTTLSDTRDKLQYAEEKSKIPPTKSQELTEFLNDINGHGYSFVRVNPDDVLMRSPRN